ncbi:hypothetical protein [Rhizobium lentis]|uniref:DUF2793 domain-containing protein n=1 Tax=Rhizobium lentis TaxID=1138194 RepID=A0ABS7IFI9_9HYPH|nr:hypothetical protein [Rhizobium lentis]MBX5089343.1 hypothetical protein [Rhizobium lentis]
MPRNGSGTSSVINTFVIDTIADPDEVNANFDDVADQLTNSLPRDGQAGMNAPLPLQNGTNSAPALTFTSDTDTGIYRVGANKMGVALGGVALPFDAGVLYAAKSANYTAVASDNNAVHRYTATATVSLDPAATLGANWHYTVIADGADVTIDPNGAETIDGATTMVVPNGSAAHIICSGTAFFTDKAESKLQPYATIASAATTDLGTVGSQNVTVTGTTTITSFGTVAAGTFRRLVFSGILTLTHNATSLILPQGGNVVTAAGDSLEAVSLGSGNWRVTSYQKASAGAGLISGTVVSASGTAIDFTSLPSWIKRITVSFENLSTSGTTGISLQLGDSGGIETSGYTCSTSNTASSTTEFLLTGGSSAAVAVYSGNVILTLVDAATNKWAAVGNTARTDVIGFLSMGGSKATSATLDRIRVKTGNGVETFDAGSVNILYE